MPIDFLVPTGPDLVNNGVWQQGGPLSALIGSANDDPNLVGDPPPNSPGCLAIGDFITSVSITPAVYEFRMTDLQGGRISINSIQAHLNGVQVGSANTFLDFLTNDGAGPTLVLAGLSSGNNGSPTCTNPVFGGLTTINTDTGEAWLPQHLIAPYMRFNLRSNNAFMNLRYIGWLHLHVDSNLGGDLMETIGMSWLPPLIASGLGDLLLKYEDLGKLTTWLSRNWRCRPDNPMPALHNRAEREWLFSRLQNRLRFRF